LHSREKMRCADFRVFFSLWVQGPQPLPPTAQVILPSPLPLPLKRGGQ
jgi:hypothetical protein